jgi:transposase
VIHAIVDNYATHKHPKVLEWLADHPRWTFHFTPTSGSWLNAVENFFSVLTRRAIRRGVFKSVADLQDAIRAYIRRQNADPTPFVWTKPAETILAKLRSALQKSGSHDSVGFPRGRFADVTPLL